MSTYKAKVGPMPIPPILGEFADVSGSQQLSTGSEIWSKVQSKIYILAFAVRSLRAFQNLYPSLKLCIYLWFPLIKFISNFQKLIFNEEFPGIQLGYQGFDIWYPKLKTGTVRDTRIPPISNPVVILWSQITVWLHKCVDL